VNEMCNKLNICSGDTKMGCDGEGAIILVSNFHDKINSSRKHFDMLGAIHNAIELSPIKWTFHHIRGHQDDFLEFQDLGRDEQLNVMADNMAKEKLSSFISTVNWRYKRPINISYERCSVDWTNQLGTRIRISSHLQKTLQSHIQQVKAREYWMKKKSISPYYERQIDWKLLHKSHLALVNHRHRWLSKWLTGFCGVGIMLQRYRHQSHSDCPRCGITGETTAHIIQCQDNRAKLLWAQEILKIERWMTDNDGHPEMIQIICSILRNWQLLKNALTPQPMERTLILAYHQQKQIGWFNFIQGFFSMQWRICQAEYLTRIKSKKSAILWMSRLQQRLYLAIWEMWNHRNQLLHGVGDRVHSSTLATIDTDVHSEWKRGMDNLPLRYAHLFSGTVEKSLQLTPQDKKRWLTSVWAARDKLNGGIQLWDRTSNIDYDKWKAKRTPIGHTTNDSI
jgi:hypothetical protein